LIEIIRINIVEYNGIKRIKDYKLKNLFYAAILHVTDFCVLLKKNLLTLIVYLKYFVQWKLIINVTQNNVYLKTYYRLLSQ